MVADALVMATHFARTRWRLDFCDRARLEAWQHAQLTRFLRQTLPRAPRFQGSTPTALSALPLMDKATMMADFAAYNTRGVALDAALAIALKAETTRDFAPMLGNLTIGLSSGTSSNRGVFLVSKPERLRWAGILLARALPSALFRQVVTPWLPPLRIGFFLRANSNLYTTLNSRRTAFDFYDVLLGVSPAVPRLNASPPDVLVGSPSLLRALAAEARAGHLRIRPRHIISVAEVLETQDANAVHAAFGVTPHQLYQATEGFLAYTCEQGTLHLNESFVHVEPDWLDTAHTRFQPILTDFTRDTQLIVRYRLNDVLRVADAPCPCGRVERAIAAVEAARTKCCGCPRTTGGTAVAIFPDLLRRAMLFAGPMVREFDLCQTGMQLTVGLQADGEHAVATAHVAAALDTLWRSLGVVPPRLVFTGWHAPIPGVKRRRIRMARAPEGLACTF